MQMHIGVAVRFLICLCLVGYTAAKCEPEICGSMNVSYPFWIDNPDCGYPGFQIKCKKNSTGMRAPYLPALLGKNNNNLVPSDYKIMEINYTGYLTINSSSLKAWSCMRKKARNGVITFQLPSKGPFTISMSNRFVVIGCNIFGAYTYENWGDVRCVSVCVSQSYPPYCRYGCCEVILPNNWKWINFTGSGVFGYDSKCGFSTVLDPSTFTQGDNETNLFWGLKGIKASYGLRLNWGIGLQNCSMAKATTNYSCSSKAECNDSPSGEGHVCNCLPGYQGNGYSNGTDCTDVDECSNSSLNVCVGRWKGGICHNLAGAYNCSCAKGYIGDGFQNGTGCTSTNSKNSIIPAIIGCASSFVGVSVGACGLFWWRRRRRLRQNFKQNCGIRLQKHIASKGGKDFRIFSERELQRASKSYSTELGGGSFGTVYKGVLSDGRPVAIKKPKSTSNELINEIMILSHISHRNVVKLLGCCMESRLPLLVYEFVPNGTLFQHLESRENHLPWERRLQIAIETAEAVAYMHHEASQPIFHRDIKSLNILLDDTFTPKVADFGLSRLQPSHETHLSTKSTSGTLGYEDPQFKTSGQFTNKSDVYSFGVVLVELLTGEPAVMSPDELSGDSNMYFLYDYFLSAFNGNRLIHILDTRVTSDRTLGQMKNMANLAKACLEMQGMARPSMREVVEELAWIRGGTRQPGLHRDVTLVEHRGSSAQATLNHYSGQAPGETTSSEDPSTSSIQMSNMH